MELLLRIVGIITPVLVIAAVGYGYGRLLRPNMAAVNRLSTDVLFPALIFSAMAAKDFVIVDYLPLLAAGFVMHLGSGVIGWGVARLLGYNVHAFVPSMMFTNTANMGLPLTLFAFGPALLPPAVALFMVSSLLHFTLGIRITAPHASLRGSLLQVSLPPWLGVSLKMLGDAAIPLGLFTLGVGFASFRVERWSVGIVGALLCPLSSLAVIWPLVSLLDFSSAQRGLLLLYAALPPAVMNYILADRYQQDPGLVSAIVVGGNIASLGFVPLALYLGL
mgnify:CR=1 FL=1